MICRASIQNKTICWKSIETYIRRRKEILTRNTKKTATTYPTVSKKSSTRLSVFAVKSRYAVHGSGYSTRTRTGNSWKTSVSSGAVKSRLGLGRKNRTKTVINSRSMKYDGCMALPWSRIWKKKKTQSRKYLIHHSWRGATRLPFFYASVSCKFDRKRANGN